MFSAWRTGARPVTRSRSGFGFQPRFMSDCAAWLASASSGLAELLGDAIRDHLARIEGNAHTKRRS